MTSSHWIPARKPAANIVAIQYLRTHGTIEIEVALGEVQVIAEQRASCARPCRGV